MGSRFVVLAHREPYAEVATPEGTEIRRKTNGVFTTLDAVLREQHGTWIAWKEAPADGPDFPLRITTPDLGDRPGYAVRRIPLRKAEARRFYYDFTSTAIWPVLFSMLDRARFTEASWDTYRRVNEAFAQAACEEADEGALIWVNDFHLMLVPRLLKERRPDLRIALFLHTAFPPPDTFGIIPWREQLLDGLLHLDLIGFHVPSYALNFANTAERFMGAEPCDVVSTDLIASGPAVAVSRHPSTLRYRGRCVRLGAYPVGIDVERFVGLAQTPETAERRAAIRQRTAAEVVVLSAERLDYVKGLIERLECFERRIENHPEWRGKISFIQIAVPTRTGMDEFQEMRRLTEEAVGRINGRFGTVEWQPVHHFYNSFPADELVAFYAAADVMWVTPLRDGLNLVVKEYVATRTDETGVVILSEFAGAAAELDGVILTNPYSPDGMDRALDDAIKMPPAERTARMQRLRRRVIGYDVHHWARQFLGDAERITP